MTEHLNHDRWSAPTVPASIDPVLQAPFDRLAQRNAAPPSPLLRAKRKLPDVWPTRLTPPGERSDVGGKTFNGQSAAFYYALDVAFIVLDELNQEGLIPRACR